MFAIVGTVIGIAFYGVFVTRRLRRDMKDAEALGRWGAYSLTFFRTLQGLLIVLPFAAVGALLDWIFDTGIGPP